MKAYQLTIHAEDFLFDHDLAPHLWRAIYLNKQTLMNAIKNTIGILSYYSDCETIEQVFEEYEYENLDEFYEELIEEIEIIED